MDRVTSIGYHSGASYVHRLDPRTRLSVMVLTSFFALKSGIPELALLTLLVLLLFQMIRLPMRAVLWDLRWFFLLLLAVFMARSFEGGGDPVFPWPPGMPGREGIREGAMIAWRLLIVVFYGVVLIATTSSRQVRDAAQWFFRPVPFIDERQVAVMLGLMMRFFPGILIEAGKTTDAQRARCVDRRRNPVFRLRVFAVPFIRRVSEDADRLALAMDARAFSIRAVSRSPGRFAFRDWVVLAASIAALGIVRLYR
jgi:energy-coupling factor transporter transmembrane protein EcfT